MATINRPCPSCGSKNVRWRKRRWYDSPLNFLETILTGTTTISVDQGIGSMSGATARPYVDDEFMRDRGIEEAKRRSGRHIAELFWRCSDCHDKGEAFEADYV